MLSGLPLPNHGFRAQTPRPYRQMLSRFDAWSGRNMAPATRARATVLCADFGRPKECGTTSLLSKSAPMASANHEARL